MSDITSVEAQEEARLAKALSRSKSGGRPSSTVVSPAKPKYGQPVDSPRTSNQNTPIKETQTVRAPSRPLQQQDNRTDETTTTYVSQQYNANTFQSRKQLFETQLAQNNTPSLKSQTMGRHTAYGALETPKNPVASPAKPVNDSYKARQEALQVSKTASRHFNQSKDEPAAARPVAQAPVSPFVKDKDAAPVAPINVLPPVPNNTPSTVTPANTAANSPVAPLSPKANPQPSPTATPKNELQDSVVVELKQPLEQKEIHIKSDAKLRDEQHQKAPEIRKQDFKAVNDLPNKKKPKKENSAFTMLRKITTIGGQDLFHDFQEKVFAARGKSSNKSDQDREYIKVAESFAVSKYIKETVTQISESLLEKHQTTNEVGKTHNPAHPTSAQDKPNAQQKIDGKEQTKEITSDETIRQQQELLAKQKEAKLAKKAEKEVLAKQQAANSEIAGKEETQSIALAPKQGIREKSTTPKQPEGSFVKQLQAEEEKPDPIALITKQLSFMQQQMEQNQQMVAQQQLMHQQFMQQQAQFQQTMSQQFLLVGQQLTELQKQQNPGQQRGRN